MAVIGTFKPEKDGGWSGYIRTLTINVKVRFVPNDNQASEHAPAFRIYAGGAELGAAWHQRTNGENPREYLSVRLDDPSLPEPVLAAMFETTGGQEAQLIWNRRKTVC
jgi:uncharacterized protein (DUF736 family)